MNDSVERRETLWEGKRKGIMGRANGPSGVAKRRNRNGGQAGGRKVGHQLVSRRTARLEALTPESLESGTRPTCCSSRRCFDNIRDVSFFLQERRKILLYNRLDRKKYLKSILDDRNEFVFDRLVVCSRFLREAFGCSNDLQCAVKGTDRAVASSTVETAPRLGRESPVMNTILKFLRLLTETQGDFMPDKDEIHLSWSQNRSVYLVLLEEWAALYAENLEDQPPSESYFNAVWKKHMPNVKVRKVHRFSVCDTCDKIRRDLEKCGSHFAAAEDLRRAKVLHLGEVAKERAQYRSNMQKAQENPDQFASVIVDGADQSEFGLPHFNSSAKSSTGHAMKMSVVGVLEHRAGKTKHLWLFTMTEDFETGSNHVIEAIHRWLQCKTEECNGQLPATLFVQVDNCSRENKNKYFMAFMEMLVARGIFQSVYVSFLPVGHTHEDIDQAFSCTSRFLRVHEAITPMELVQCLKQSYNPAPTVMEMKTTANFSGLLESTHCLLPAPGNVTLFRYFVFARGGGLDDAGFYRTTVSVKKKVDGPLDLLRPKSARMGRGFLARVPDLRQTPPYKTKALTNKYEILKRICSEEVRIDSALKMRELKQLCNLVYSCSRVIAFHWPENSVEFSVPNENGQEGSRGSEHLTEDENCATGYVEQELEYVPNEFVAVRAGGEKTGEPPFWIGLISKVVRGENGLPQDLTVVWYEPRSSEDDPYAARYKPCWQRTARAKRAPLSGNAAVQTVLVSFQCLTVDNRLSVCVQKKISESLAASATPLD